MTAVASVHDGPVNIVAAYAFGNVLGEIVIPLMVIVGIASIWKLNRGFRGIVRVLCWASLAIGVMQLLLSLANWVSNMLSNR
jgi:hypothetical protein